ncbi:MAG: DNA-binding response regulator [Aureispira sp.]
MSNNNPIRLAIVDDEQLIVRLLEDFFNREPSTEVVFTAFEGIHLLAFLEQNVEGLDVLLLDLHLQEENGADIAEQLRQNYPHLQVIIISSYYKASFIGYLLKTGVSAFLPKGILPRELLNIIQTVYDKGYYFLPEQVEAMRGQITSKAPQPKFATNVQLTSREQEILNLICQQKTAQEIAEQLFITKRTVEGHKNNLLSKLGIKNTAGLIVYAIKEGLIDLNSIQIK